MGGGRKDLEEIGGEETIIKIYFMKKNLFSTIKGKGTWVNFRPTEISAKPAFYVIVSKSDYR